MDDAFCRLARDFARAGVTTAEAAEAFNRAARLMPPPGQEEIVAVRMNPSLTRFQKWRIIRQIKKRKVKK